MLPPNSPDFDLTLANYLRGTRDPDVMLTLRCEKRNEP
jgi:hypothetical protein